MNVRKFAILLFAFALSLTAAPRLQAEELIEVGTMNDLLIKLDASSIIWHEDKISFNYLALPQTTDSAKQFDDYFNVKGTASAKYEIIVDLFGDTYVVDQMILTNAQGKQLANTVDQSGAQEIVRSQGVSRCMKIIAEQKLALSPNMAAQIGKRYISAGQASKAVPFLEAAAEGNVDNVSFELGNLYYEGQGVNKDYKKAREYFEAAYEGADRDRAACMLGALYYDGKGVKRDYKKAIAYFKESAESGYYLGYTKLGYAYYEGKAVKKSSKKARENFARAIEMGDNSEETMAMYKQVDNTIREQQLKDKAQMQAIYKRLGLDD